MTIRAKYAGTCTVCGQPIKVGDTIEWKKGEGSRHVECKPTEIPTDAIRLHGGSGYGCCGWQVGQIVAQKHNEGLRYLYVLSASSRYIREDGMSFGVGDESGHTYSAVCRVATAEEAAPLIAKREANERQKLAAADLAAIAELIRTTGERPEGSNTPEGERISDTQNLYGGGEWFVVGPEWIWYVKNNGADGDNWSCNNIRTQGAGAIGWRVAHTAELDARLRAASALADRKPHAF